MWRSCTLGRFRSYKAHSRTHSPYESWCGEDVAGRGEENPHSRLDSEPAHTLVIACGFHLFPVTGQDEKEDLSESPMMVDCETTCTTSCVVPKKGRIHSRSGFEPCYCRDSGLPAWSHIEWAYGNHITSS